MHLRIKSRVRIRYLGNDRPARPLGTWVLSTGIFEQCQPVELKLRDNRVTHGITWLHPNPMILEPHVPDSSMVNGEAICAKQTATKIDGPTNTRIRSWKSPNYMASKKKIPAIGHGKIYVGQGNLNKLPANGNFHACLTKRFLPLAADWPLALKSPRVVICHCPAQETSNIDHVTPCEKCAKWPTVSIGSLRSPCVWSRYPQWPAVIAVYKRIVIVLLIHNEVSWGFTWFHTGFQYSTEVTWGRQDILTLWHLWSWWS